MGDEFHTLVTLGLKPNLRLPERGPARVFPLAGIPGKELTRLLLEMTLQYACLHGKAHSSPLLGSAAHPLCVHPPWEAPPGQGPLPPARQCLQPLLVTRQPRGPSWWLSGKEPACSAGDVVRSLSQEDPLEEEMATHSCILAWEIPWTEEPGGHSIWGSKETWLSN